MGKSVRTSLMSYTSLYLRRSRTAAASGPRPSESSRTAAPHPIASNSSSHPGQGEIKELSRSLRVASGILSNTTRDHPTSMPRGDRRCEDEHGPRHYRPFFMPLSTEVSRRPPRAPVGPQLHYLTVHLVEGLAEPGLQPCPPVIGKVSGHSPRFFEKHAHVLQLRYLGLCHLAIS